MLHNAEAQAGDDSTWTTGSSVQWHGRRQQPIPSPGVQSVSKAPSISRRGQGLSETEGRPPTNDEIDILGFLINTSGCVVT